VRAERLASIAAIVQLFLHLITLTAPIILPTVIAFVDMSSIIPTFMEIKLEWHKRSAVYSGVELIEAKIRWNLLLSGTLNLFICAIISSMKVRYYSVFIGLVFMTIVIDFIVGNVKLSDYLLGYGVTIIIDRGYLLFVLLLVFFYKHFSSRRREINA